MHIRSANALRSCFAVWMTVQAWGCAGSSRGHRADSYSPTSNLVLTDEPVVDDAGRSLEADRWTFGRNDGLLGGPSGSSFQAVQLVEVRQRDFQRTINGRPREYSTTITSSIKRSAVR